MNQMNVIYAANENYAKLVWISACSLFKNNKNCRIKVYLISDNITEESIRNIKKLVEEYHGELVVIDFYEVTYGLENADIFSGSKTSYARLFIPNIITEDKLLYLDCDTLVMGTLDDIWNLDISDVYVAGVQDTVVPHIRYGIGLEYSDTYLNSGVLLMNVKKMREDDLQRKFVDYIKEMQGSVPCHDQGVINHVCKDSILVLSLIYNVMTPVFEYTSDEIMKFYELKHYYTDSEIQGARKNPKIIHFTAGWYVRPWFSNSKHPYAETYNKYYDISPWKNVSRGKGTIHKKVRLIKMMYNVLPFRIFVKIAKWKRG